MVTIHLNSRYLPRTKEDKSQPRKGKVGVGRGKSNWYADQLVTLKINLSQSLSFKMNACGSKELSASVEVQWKGDYALNYWFSKCGPRTSRNSITWKFVTNSNSQAPPRANWNKTLGAGLKVGFVPTPPFHPHFRATALKCTSKVYSVSSGKQTTWSSRERKGSCWLWSILVTSALTYLHLS